MIVSGHIPPRHVESDSTGDDVLRAVKFFRWCHGKDAVIDSIDERSVVGFCEACELPIFEGDPYNHDDEGVQVHEICPVLSEAPR